MLSYPMKMLSRFLAPVFAGLVSIAVAQSPAAPGAPPDPTLAAFRPNNPRFVEFHESFLKRGKEGPIGLMPPVGSVLSDDQIAAVLTYIRREWGQAGTAVDAAAVKNTRALVAGRTKPWTDAELLAIIK